MYARFWTRWEFVVVCFIVSRHSSHDSQRGQLLTLFSYTNPAGPPAVTTEWLARKYHIWLYFNYVIHHANHRRHRLYVHLERQSIDEIETRHPGSRRLWGNSKSSYFSHPCSLFVFPLESIHVFSSFPLRYTTF